MRRLIAASAALLFTLMLALQTAQAADKIRWADSLSAAMQKSKASNKLVMMDFYTDW